MLLNRAPTLHRLSIQLSNRCWLKAGPSRSILWFAALQRGFDGDQMPVHVPLSAEAQAEAKILMASKHNLLLPKDGTPAITPTKDIVLGIYYLTLTDHDDPEQVTEEEVPHKYASMDEAIMAYETKKVGLHDL